MCKIAEKKIPGTENFTYDVKTATRCPGHGLTSQMNNNLYKERRTLKKEIRQAKKTGDLGENLSKVYELERKELGLRE